jgi:hypothetical protein
MVGHKNTWFILDPYRIKEPWHDKEKAKRQRNDRKKNRVSKFHFCKMCHKKFRRLDSHHEPPRWIGGGPADIIQVCHPCHANAESYFKEIIMISVCIDEKRNSRYKLSDIQKGKRKITCARKAERYIKKYGKEKICLKRNEYHEKYLRTKQLSTSSLGEVSYTITIHYNLSTQHFHASSKPVIPNLRKAIDVFE